MPATQTRTQKLVVLGMLSALACIVMWTVRVPFFGFLTYDPKDIVIVLGGFLFGPLAAAAMGIVVPLIEMVTVSHTAWIGFVMSALATCAFTCTAAFIYQKKRTLTGVVLGLVVGCVMMTAVMLLFNIILYPLFAGVPRAAVYPLLIPMLLPFNVLKSVLNASLALLLFKPVTLALSRARLLPPPVKETKRGMFAGVTLLALFVVATCVLWALVLLKVI